MHLFATDFRRKKLTPKQGWRHFWGRILITKFLKTMKEGKIPSCSGLWVTLETDTQKSSNLRQHNKSQVSNKAQYAELIWKKSSFNSVPKSESRSFRETIPIHQGIQQVNCWMSINTEDITSCVAYGPSTHTVLKKKNKKTYLVDEGHTLFIVGVGGWEELRNKWPHHLTLPYIQNVFCLRKFWKFLLKHTHTQF